MNEVLDLHPKKRPSEGYKGPCLMFRCREDAYWKPILLVKPLGWRFLPTNSKRGYLTLEKEGALCETHRNTPANQLISDDDWTQLQQLAQRLELPTPDRASVKVKIVRMVKG